MVDDKQDSQPQNFSTEFEQAIAQSSTRFYHFRLYVSGATFNSINALQNIKDICERYLPGRYKLDVINIYNQPNAVVTDNVVAIPTLIKELPPPLQKIIGDLSDREKVLISLDISSGEMPT